MALSFEVELPPAFLWHSFGHSGSEKLYDASGRRKLSATFGGLSKLGPLFEIPFERVTAGVEQMVAIFLDHLRLSGRWLNISTCCVCVCVAWGRTTVGETRTWNATGGSKSALGPAIFVGLSLKTTNRGVPSPMVAHVSQGSFHL